MGQPTGGHEKGDEQQSPHPTPKTKDQRTDQDRADHTTGGQGLAPVGQPAHDGTQEQAQKKLFNVHGTMLNAANQKRAWTAAAAPQSRYEPARSRR